MSIRLRLTLLYSAIVALTLIVFSVVLYVILQRVVISGVDQALVDEKKRLLNNARPNPVDERIIDLPATLVAAPTTYFQIRSFDGELRQQSPNLEELQLELPLSDAARAALQTRDYTKDTAVLDGQRWRINSAIIPLGGRSGFVLQVARSLAQQDETLKQLAQILMVGSGVATIAAFGIGWLLAGAALRPIDRITNTAHAIGVEHDFNRRVSYGGPPDEIGRLATTFNGMLAALQAAFKQEAQALQAQRRFVADASHELRTPLTTIRGNLGLLQREPPISDEDRVAVLADMSEESERMSRLINDLLVLARADAGRVLRSEPVAVQPVVEDLCRNARLLAPGRLIECSAREGVVIQGDPDALKQVLLILLDNALKFTPPAGYVSISAREAGDHASIEVKDTGVGIAPDALPHIFERFYRGDASRTGAGAGLGLSIARTLVQAQGGTLGVQSTLGRGSTFTVTLPASRSAALPVPAPELAASARTH